MARLILKALTLLIAVCHGALASQLVDLSEQEKRWLNGNPTITFTGISDLEPAMSLGPNGKAVGIIPDYLHLMSTAIDHPIVVTPVIETFQYAHKNISENDSHGFAIVFDTAENRKRYLISEPLTQTPFNIFTTAENLSKIKSKSDLEGKRVAALSGHRAITRYLETIEDIKIISAETPTEQMKMVQYGQADALIGYATYHHMITKLMFTDIKMAFASETLHKIHIGIKQEHPELLSIINKAIPTLSTSQKQEIVNSWITRISNALPSNSDDLGFSQEELDYLNSKKAISMCIDPDWMPFEKIENRQHIGMTADYFELLSATVPVPIELVHTNTWTESLEKGKQRKCDIFSLVMPTPERLEYLDFTSPYLKTPLVLVTGIEEPFIDDISKATGRDIGIVRGYAYGEILQKQHPELTMVQVDNLDHGLNLVDQGKLYGLIGTLSATGYHIQKSFVGSLKITGKFDNTWDLGIGTRNDEPLLHDVFEKAIKSIPASTHQEILNKWISVTYQNGIDYSFLWKAAAVVALILFGSVYWNMRLSSANKKTQEALQALHNAQTELKRLAITDTLTGLYNRAKLDEELEYEISRSERSNRPFSIMLIDLDHFKQVNDSKGHQVGDQVLFEVAQLLQEGSRETDVVGRWGGEEFMIICPETDTEGAETMAENIRGAIENHHFTFSTKQSASIGTATFKEKDTLGTVMARADKALYQAKREGRNCVIAG